MVIPILLLLLSLHRILLEYLLRQPLDLMQEVKTLVQLHVRLNQLLVHHLQLLVMLLHLVQLLAQHPVVQQLSLEQLLITLDIQLQLRHPIIFGRKKTIYWSIHIHRLCLHHLRRIINCVLILGLCLFHYLDAINIFVVRENFRFANEILLDSCVIHLIEGCMFNFLKFQF